MSEQNRKIHESWDIETTRYMLRLVREKQVMSSLDGKRFPAEDIFSCLEGVMHNMGYLKSAQQIQCRFRTLRFQLNQYKRKLSVNGESNSRKQFPFFQEMNVLLGDRPVAVMEGVDSEGASPNSDEKQNSLSGVESLRQYNQDNDALENASGSYIADVSDNEVDRERQYIKKQKRTVGNTSYKQVLQNYAEMTKENASELQANLLDKQQQFIGTLFKQQRKSEKDMFATLVNSQRETMMEVTNVPLNGIQNISQMAPCYPPSTFMAGPLPFFTPSSVSPASPK